MKKAKNKFLILIILIIICIVGFFVLNAAYEKLQNTMYPQKYSQLVSQYANEFNIEENIIYTVIHTESGFDSDARSNVNAIGLMQITQETFDWIKSKIARDEDLVFEDLFKPEVAIRFGTYYMAKCMYRYSNDLSTAAAAYHSGWGTVDKLLTNSKAMVLTEFPYNNMNRYVSKITKCYDKYKELYS